VTWTYTLDDAEAHLIEVISALRYASNLGRPNAYGLKGDGRDEGALGTGGEYAASRLLNVSWEALSANPWAPGHVDIGLPVQRLQVRTTSNMSIPLHDKDNPDHYYLAVTREDPFHYTLHGWVLGRDGQRSGYWAENIPRPCFMVPLRRLTPINDALPPTLAPLR